MKKQKGITLIALIITIIVLLILAGVSISIMTGENGVLTQAQESVEKAKQAKLQELHDLTSANAAMNLEGYIYTDRIGKKVYIPVGFEVSQVTRDVEEVKNGELQAENEVDNGLVIIDKYGDEFVWIPVKTDGSDFTRKISKSYKIKFGVGDNDGSSEIIDLRDDFGENKLLLGSTSNGETTDKELETVKKAGGFFVSRYEIGADGSVQRELIRPSGNKQDVGTFDINYYENSADTSSNKDEKYWKDAVAKDESTKNSENPTTKRQAIIDRILPQLQSKQGVEPVRGMTQDECLALANKWKKGKDCQSGLMTGRTWDRMLSYICDDNVSNNEFDISEESMSNNSSSWGNYAFSTKSIKYKSIFISGDANGMWILKSSGWERENLGYNYRVVLPTGKFISKDGTNTRKKNVYDVAGNVWEWTTEESHYVEQDISGKWPNRIIRGGCASDSGNVSPASIRAGHHSGTTFGQWNGGFRCVLYVTN